MGRILNEKLGGREAFNRDSCLNFEKRNEADLSPLNVLYQKNILELDEEIIIDTTTINPIFYNQVISVFAKTNDIFSDKGINTLFVISDIVHFKFVEDPNVSTFEQTLHAPLIFWETKFSFVNENQISILIDRKPIYNKKLINLLNDVYNLEQKMEVDDDWDVEKFKKLFFANFPNVSASELYKGTYLGSFDPFEKRIKTEIREIANMNIDLYSAKPINSKADYIQQELHEEPMLIINNPLNFYQKIAVRSALTENTIIYGPPGTGKSEIIVNIIANAITNEKTMLVTCEKKTALDVLLERLGKIEGLCLFLNSIDNEDLVYKKISDIQELLGLTWFFDPQQQQESEQESTDEQQAKTQSLKPFSLKDSIYELNSIKTFSKRTIDFYKKIQDSIDLDFLSKTSLDFSSYQTENKTLLHELSAVDGWDELVAYKNKFFGQNESIWTLITKIYYYVQFKNDYMLDDFTINEYFKQIDQFNLIKTKSLFSETKDLQDNFNKRYQEFYTILDSINLQNDQNFFNEMQKDYFIFERQIKVMMKIHEMYPHIIQNEDFVNFLLNNVSHHQEFIDSIQETPEYYRFSALDKYITTGQIRKKGKIKKFANPKFLKDIYNVIKLFASMTVPKNCEYLLKNNPHEIWSYLTADLVFFYLNEKMKSEEMNFLILNDIIRVDKKICDIVTKTNISLAISRIKKLSQFEEINIKNKEFSDKTMNSYIVNFYKENSQNIETISENIYNKYIDWLRNQLMDVPYEFKKKAIEMFQVAKVPNNRMKITNFIKRYYPILKKIFPIWIGSPIDVSNYCAFERNIFDIVIIDESSQMLMENALPALYRANHYVVAGDDKQLKATVAFKKRYRNSDQLDYQEEIDFDIVESLLDRANVALWNNFILRNHYRSEKQELIAFSNEYIYNNQLIFATKNRKSDKALEVINVKNGFYIDSVNEREAEQVIRTLSEVIKNDEYKSFLVITFSVKQSEYIQRLIVQSRYAGKFNDLMSENKLKIKNLENVQGFEADCVILSVSHGRKDEDSKLKSSFGPLIQDGGMNRLNVAITRAKSKMYVIKSMYAHEMSLNRDNRNLMTFYNFINYLDSIDQHYQSLIDVVKNHNTKYKYGNEIIEYIKENLDPSVKYTCQHKLGNFMADVVFYTKDLNNIELVVCLDYWSKYNEASELLASVNTQEYLMAIGYDFIRIKELEWQFNPQEVMKNLDEAVERINRRLHYAKTNKEPKTTKKTTKPRATKSATKEVSIGRTKVIKLPEVAEEKPVKEKPKKVKKGKSVRAKRNVKADPKTTIIKSVLNGLGVDNTTSERPARRFDFGSDSISKSEPTSTTTTTMSFDLNDPANSPENRSGRKSRRGR